MAIPPATIKSIRQVLLNLIIMAAPIGAAYLKDEISLKIGLISSLVLAVAFLVFQKELDINRLIANINSLIAKAKAAKEKKKEE